MKTAKGMVLFSLCLIFNVLSVNMAAAGNGTLTFTYKYQDPATGAIATVPSAFVYLHDAAKPPPMEKYFSTANRILWGSFGNGNYQVTVPEGTWYVRINQRADAANRNSMGAKGPPRGGDFTWIPPAPITIKAGQTINLGTIYASLFNASPITLTGTVKNFSTGAPLAGYYVRVQTDPCVFNMNCGPDGDVCQQTTNKCGPDKYVSLATDASGAFTVNLRDAGTYYVYATNCFSDGAGCDGWCASPCVGYAYPTPVTVKKGDTKTLTILGR